MRIIQEADFGEHGSAVEGYFRHLEKVYERSSVLIRNRKARATPQPVDSRPNQPRQRGQRVDWVDQRTYASEDAGGDKAENDSGEDGSEISSHERRSEAEEASGGSDGDGGEISSHERRSEGENGSGEDGSEISSHESDSDGEGDSDEDRAPSKTCLLYTSPSPRDRG